MWCFEGVLIGCVLSMCVEVVWVGVEGVLSMCGGGVLSGCVDRVCWCTLTCASS